MGDKRNAGTLSAVTYKKCTQMQSFCPNLELISPSTSNTSIAVKYIETGHFHRYNTDAVTFTSTFCGACYDFIIGRETPTLAE